MNKRDNMFKAHAAIVEQMFGPRNMEPKVKAIPERLTHDLVEHLATLINRRRSDVVSDPISANERVHSSCGHTELLLSKPNTLDWEQLFQRIPVQVELNPFDPVIHELHNELRMIFRADVGGPFAFVNSRAMISNPCEADPIGPFSLHVDGFCDGHLKIMVYLTGVNETAGGMVFSNYGRIPDSRPGTAVLFDNSALEHAGINCKSGKRVAIEITLFRSLADFPQLTRSHFFGRHFDTPRYFYRIAHERFRYPQHPRMQGFSRINIGSGIREWDDTWLLLDEIDHKAVSQTSINSELLIPAFSGTCSLVYTSHHIEHLPDIAVSRVLSESRRCLSTSGRLVIKVPDFDYFLTAFFEKDSRVIGEICRFDNVMWSWARKGVEPNIENSLSMMFCGYWTKAYGDHFSRKIDREHPHSYHGPAMMSRQDLNGLFETKDPHKIAAELCEAAKSDIHFSRFNHQNAWSKQQLINLVEDHGFELVGADKKVIMRSYDDDIPDLCEMADWSMYLEFSPV